MLNKILQNDIFTAIESIYSVSLENIQLQKTRQEFKGDITLVVFPFTRFSKKSPEETGYEIGIFLKKNIKKVEEFNVVKGFLNLSICDSFWTSKFYDIYDLDNFGIAKADKDSPTFLVEYSSPNTNKPIHLGHLRNNFLGYSLAKILSANGKNVKKVQIINDRGIHICKSMVAWLKFGNGETPRISGIKGGWTIYSSCGTIYCI